MPRTILLADDSITIRKVVELTFAETGIRVVAVGSGREALDRLPDVSPDLVLADVVMPEPSGYEVCRAVKASARPVPVLLLAGTFEPFDAERARRAGADGQLTKPFESRALVERVEALLASAAAPAPAPPLPAQADAADVEQVMDEVAGAMASPRPAPAAPAGDPVEAMLEEAAAVPEPEPPPGPRPTPAVPGLSDADVERIARAVASRLAEEVVRQVAWEVVPETAERLVREKLRQLEREEAD